MSSSNAFDDFLDDCFVEHDPICSLYIEDSLWFDQYASKLAQERVLQAEQNQTRI